MNVVLKGVTKQIVEEMVKAGYANTKSEAIRLSITNFRQNRMNEEELVNRKLDRIDEQVKTGKRKLLNAKQAMGPYAKHLK
jgi:Arc/MetJ-type ribon-helix-helix transcriptional regulator